ncbi:sensor histidine kinase [Streptomyces lichenis]|uniref:histidine kinase n=1 Tax=Streptomyces lichenis TaxID=2306967 RepID=A0ABT0IBP1_9ACTN|nr:histidine kinase [Streptomyces lichenis]MCK8678739.1 histidine kinase [Streptomyces lichenis]
MRTGGAPRRGPWQQAARFAAAAAVGVSLWVATAAMVEPGCAAHSCSWLATGDPLIAVGCLAALFWRHRFPLAVALSTAVASAGSTLAAGAALLALGSLSTRRRPPEIALAVAAFVVAPLFVGELYPLPSAPGSFWLPTLTQALAGGAAVAAGTAVGARRAEVRSLRERAHGAEREQRARADRARALERNRIAREMHDVLAHRISLVAMQAGALDHRADLAAEEARVLVRGIVDGSHQALEELRDVLGVLRADPDRPEQRPPSLARVPALVAEARSYGLDAVFASTVTAEPPEAAGRTCYRTVQEALTNAAKHAPGSRVRVTVDGAPGGDLRVAVRNGPATAAATGAAASGFGLPGLAERVALLGGELDYHPTADGGYLLSARLPWPRPPDERRS